MIVKAIINEDFNNYKKPAMFIGAAKCNWKCAIEGGFDISICQNSSLASQPDIDIPDSIIYARYKENPLTNAIVIGGLEPMLQFNDVQQLIKYFRSRRCYDDFVIYTGYYKDEISLEVDNLKQFKNSIIKFGRFLFNDESVYDSVLGVTLASKNQYAERIC